MGCSCCGAKYKRAGVANRPATPVRPISTAVPKPRPRFQDGRYVVDPPAATPPIPEPKDDGAK